MLRLAPAAGALLAALTSVPAHANTKAVDQAPVLSCVTPASKIEWKICADAALVGLHNTMQLSYRSVEQRIRPRDDVKYLVADQRRWLERRDACWTRTCIIAAYRQRIDTLASYAVIRDD